MLLLLFFTSAYAVAVLSMFLKRGDFFRHSSSSFLSSVSLHMHGSSVSFALAFTFWLLSFILALFYLTDLGTSVYILSPSVAFTAFSAVSFSSSQCTTRALHAHLNPVASFVCRFGCCSSGVVVPPNSCLSILSPHAYISAPSFQLCFETFEYY